MSKALWTMLLGPTFTRANILRGRQRAVTRGCASQTLEHSGSSLIHFSSINPKPHNNQNSTTVLEKDALPVLIPVKRRKENHLIINQVWVPCRQHGPWSIQPEVLRLRCLDDDHSPRLVLLYPIFRQTLSTRWLIRYLAR
jgi:hypothetical protein